MATRVGAVEKLKQENKLMRIELQSLKAGNSEGFKQIGFHSGLGGYGQADPLAEPSLQ